MKIEKSKNTKKPRGGYRPGSGRKPLDTFKARALFQMAFDKHFTQEDWDDFIIRAKKDLKMITYIIDQRIGKASQAIEHTGKDGTPLFLPSELMQKNAIDASTK